ncbi:hypothetical protein SeMB42_g04159 [Synchytrium endobioticum]|uniref:Uncharacterized protein n=1 Tax=Synchytrium endobioticum TaxID=286115 RepID=A0A507D0G9_9FUNG|nr:hypothetical protein SeMB42_g04159 [Synchytrium endobioticum]
MGGTTRYGRIPFPMTIDNLENNNPGTRIYCNERSPFMVSGMVNTAWPCRGGPITLCHDEVKFSPWINNVPSAMMKWNSPSGVNNVPSAMMK